MALSLLEQAICIRQERLGHQHPDTMLAQESLGAIRRAAVIADIPETVRAALQGQDGTSPQQALAALLPEEAETIIHRLVEVGIILVLDNDPAGPLLQAITVIAQGNEVPRAEVEAILMQREQHSFYLTAAVRAIWAGQRNPAILTADLDDTDTALIQRVLALIEQAQQPGDQ